MIKVAIIDDEQDSRETLRLYLNELYQDIEVAGEADDLETGLALIKSTNPDLVFLDINMPDGSGFDLLERLPHKNINVIFVTAYDQHAIRAFRYSAIDFLLKPVDPEMLVKAIEKFRKKVDLSSLQQRLMTLLANKNTPKKIALPTTGGYKFVLAENIRHCVSEGNYTTFFLYNGEKILVCYPLKVYEELLEGGNFYRVHQSHLIHLKYVKEYKKGEGGSVILDDNTEIQIARRRKEGFLAAMMNYGS